VIACSARGRTSGLSSYGYLFFLIGTIVLAVAAPGMKVGAVLAGALLFALLFGFGALRLLGRWQLWIFVASALLLSPLLIGEKDIVLGGVSISEEGFWAGLWMTLRALAITVAMGTFASAVSVPQMAQLFERLRLKGLGFALGVATNMLPTIQETMVTTYHALRLRGGFRRPRLETVRLFLVAIIAASLRRGDDIVSAAEARAFDPTRSQSPALRVARADLALLSVLAVAGLLLLLA
jgi:energy-coupling factor transporter transmembrane protein EcfT